MPPRRPYDAQAAVEHLLGRLRASAGATRVSVWVHEATTEMVVPFRQAVADTGEPAAEHPRLRTPVTLTQSPFLSAVIRSRASVVARADGRRAADKEIAGLGIRSAHAEPLIRRRRGRRRPHRRAGRRRRSAPAPPGHPQARRRHCRGVGPPVGEAPHRPGRASCSASSSPPSKAQSMDHLLGAACRQLAELGEVERACIFLLEDGRLVPRMAATPTAAATSPPGSSSATPRSAWQLAETVLRTGEPLPPTGTPACSRAGGSTTSTSPPASPSRSAAARTWPGSSPWTAPWCGPSPRTCAGSPPPPAPTWAASSSRPAPARPAPPR